MIKIDLNDNTKKSAASMLVARRDFCSAVLHDHIYAIGGHKTNGSVERYEYIENNMVSITSNVRYGATYKYIHCIQFVLDTILSKIVGRIWPE